MNNLIRAAKVILLDEKISAYLKKNDPMALGQLQNAVSEAECENPFQLNSIAQVHRLGKALGGEITRKAISPGRVKIGEVWKFAERGNAWKFANVLNNLPLGSLRVDISENSQRKTVTLDYYEDEYVV
jgi:hypothetical protein